MTEKLGSRMVTRTLRFEGDCCGLRGGAVCEAASKAQGHPWCLQYGARLDGERGPDGRLKRYPQCVQEHGE
jgi:hypothetical protein